MVQRVVGATLGVLVPGELLGPGFLAGSALIGAGVAGIGLAAGADHRHDEASSLKELVP